MQHIKVDHEKKLDWEQLAAAWWVFRLAQLKWQTPTLGLESAATWKDLLTFVYIVVYMLHSSVSQQLKHVPQGTENMYIIEKIHFSTNTSWYSNFDTLE